MCQKQVLRYSKTPKKIKCVKNSNSLFDGCNQLHPSGVITHKYLPFQIRPYPAYRGRCKQTLQPVVFSPQLCLFLNNTNSTFCIYCHNGTEVYISSQFMDYAMQQCKYGKNFSRTGVQWNERSLIQSIMTSWTAQCDRQCHNKWLFHLNKQLLQVLDNRAHKR